MEHVQYEFKGSCKESVEDMDLRRGPWTVEEDFTLINHIAHHGEGRWNSLARSAGLKRTGKSCRLRWLNYLRPDVRRGNITLEEQLLILELHCRWGNRWSKIAQYLPGRTDNEIKNYWRTRVQKHAKQLKCDVNSKQFKDTMRYLWMPRLVERIQAAASSGQESSTPANSTTTKSTTTHQIESHMNTGMQPNMAAGMQINPTSYMSPENSSTPASSDSFRAQVSPVSDLTDCYNCPTNQDYYHANQVAYGDSTGYFIQDLEYDHQAMDNYNQWCLNGSEACDNLLTVEDMWFLQQQLSSNV